MTACIVGWSHGKFGKLDTETSESLIVKAATEAIAHAGIEPKDIDVIYVGNMNGYLRERVDERRFLIIQFEQENDAWKFGAILDPPTSLVPKLDEKLSSGKLDFLNSKPFAPEKVDLLKGMKTDKPKGTNAPI